MITDVLDQIPRIPLASYPTPLQPLPGLSEELGRPVFIKRDDVGPGLGGNKVRKLEYLLAEARAQGCTRVATFGGAQSNHARLTAVTARMQGLEPHLFYLERRPESLRGNLTIAALAGARLHFVPVGGGKPMPLERANRVVRWLVRLRLGRSYFIPVGGHCVTGCLGYVRAALELDQQARALGIPDAHVVMAAGTGGTLAGVLAGVRLCGSGLRPLGIDVGKLWTRFSASVASMCDALCSRLGEPRETAPGEVPLVEETYVGDRYAAPSAAGVDAIRLLLRTDGVLLDPIYTGKAFAGMLDLARSGRLGDNDPLIFLHTGGAPGLFAFDAATLEESAGG